MASLHPSTSPSLPPSLPLSLPPSVRRSVWWAPPGFVFSSRPRVSGGAALACLEPHGWYLSVPSPRKGRRGRRGKRGENEGSKRTPSFRIHPSACPSVFIQKSLRRPSRPHPREILLPLFPTSYLGLPCLGNVNVASSHGCLNGGAARGRCIAAFVGLV